MCGIAGLVGRTRYAADTLCRAIKGENEMSIRKRKHIAEIIGFIGFLLFWCGALGIESEFFSFAEGITTALAGAVINFAAWYKRGWIIP